MLLGVYICFCSVFALYAYMQFYFGLGALGKSSFVDFPYVLHAFCLFVIVVISQFGLEGKILFMVVPVSVIVYRLFFSVMMERCLLITKSFVYVASWLQIDGMDMRGTLSFFYWHSSVNE